MGKPEAPGDGRAMERLGLGHLARTHWNLPAAVLYEHVIRRGEGTPAEGGALVVETGRQTGRSPKDKFIVEEPASKANIWWGEVNRPISEAGFEGIWRRMQAYLQGRDVYIRDCFAGAEPRYRLPIRIVTELAWHNLFAANMFISPERAGQPAAEPAFTIVDAPGFRAVPEIDGTNSEIFILVSFARRLVLIGGTRYAGEIKKSVFTILNYLLPDAGVLPMHSSANIGPDGTSAVFFGLSGTGKTTLSADGSRVLIGDDEHGWSDSGVFNFEGGCYAKVIRLSETAEPEIYATTRRFGTLLENVVIDPSSRTLDLDDARLTENTRASYPLDFIPNVSASGCGNHPRTIIMLTADAFGVLPPIARLSPEQAMYHFLSGYTARVAGTETGVNEPQATFSTCFGAPFMPRHPSVYAKMLGERIARHGATCWLVNTGWSGGAYGVGSRMKIAHTRTLVDAALTGALEKVATIREPNFGLAVPTACAGIPAQVLQPRETWSDKAGYDQTARAVADLFARNFRQFEGFVDAKVMAAAIRAA